MKKEIFRFLRAILVYSLLAVLLYWALRNAPLAEIWRALQHLQFWQILVILLVNASYYVIATLRWWIIVNAENKHVPFFPLLSVRVSVFGVSYFTLGPQVGGEPLQVLALNKNYGITYTHATAAVFMDKLLEFLVDFLMLAVGLSAILQAGIMIENGIQLGGSLIVLAFLILWPPLHLILLYNRRYPLTAFVHAIPFIPKNAKPIRFLRAAEMLAGKFCQRHPRRLIVALIFSALAGMEIILDYALIAAFLNIHLPFGKMAAAWMMSWMSLLMPLPGGLGALEASQVYVLGKFGFSAATALSLTLLMRGRDILIGGLGLILAGRKVAK